VEEVECIKSIFQSRYSLLEKWKLLHKASRNNILETLTFNHRLMVVVNI